MNYISPKLEAAAASTRTPDDVLKARGETMAVRSAHGHGSTHGKTPTYFSWQAMLARVRYPHRDKFGMWAAKGITVCTRWLSFENFLADMGERPEGKTLDRFPDQDGNYEPENCRWATPCEQARNTRHTKLTFDMAFEIAIARLNGVPATELANEYGISESLPREIVKGRCWRDALDAAKVQMGMALGCPFCGHDVELAQVRYINDRRYYMVGCENIDCDIQPNAGGHDLSKVWKSWNRRAGDEQF